MDDPTLRVEAALDVGVRDVDALDGGEIGEVWRVDLADGRSVVAKAGETPLSIEARMLSVLADEGLAVPDVLAASDDLLVLEYVEGDGAVTPAVERDLADRLAELHASGADAFGFPFDTLSGPLVQSNPWTDSWVDFYTDQRVRPLIDRCLDAGVLDHGDTVVERLEVALDRFEDLLVEPVRPALVHGDVWRNNLIVDGDRVRAFLDPACYYAHHEIELAYVDWTDTAGEAFFDRYDERRGIDPAFFGTRRYVYRLYPLLEHVLIFGDAYVDELSETLDRVL